MLLATSGVTRLIDRATLEHSDDHPVRFVAARRFLTLGPRYAVLIAHFQLGKAMPARRRSALTHPCDAPERCRVLPYLHRPPRAAGVLKWSVRTALSLALGDTRRPTRARLGDRSSAAPTRSRCAVYSPPPETSRGSHGLREALLRRRHGQVRAALRCWQPGSRWSERVAGARSARRPRARFGNPFPGEFLVKRLSIALEPRPAWRTACSATLPSGPGLGRYRSWRRWLRYGGPVQTPPQLWWIVGFCAFHGTRADRARVLATQDST